MSVSLSTVKNVWTAIPEAAKVGTSVGLASLLSHYVTPGLSYEGRGPRSFASHAICAVVVGMEELIFRTGVGKLIDVAEKALKIAPPQAGSKLYMYLVAKTVLSAAIPTLARVLVGQQECSRTTDRKKIRNWYFIHEDHLQKDIPQNLILNSLGACIASSTRSAAPTVLLRAMAEPIYLQATITGSVMQRVMNVFALKL